MGKYHLGLITNVASDSCAVYHTLTIRSGMGRESQLDLFPFACQWMYRTGALILLGWIVMGWFNNLAETQIRSQWITKGWACGVAEKASDWLGSYTGPHTKVCGWESTPGCATRIRSLMGKATHLYRVTKLWLVTLCSGKELRTRQEMNSTKF
jgi:hypothetical protein